VLFSVLETISTALRLSVSNFVFILIVLDANEAIANETLLKLCDMQIFTDLVS